MFFIVQKASGYLIFWNHGKVEFAGGVISCIFIGVVVYLLLNLLLKTPEYNLFKKGLSSKKSVSTGEP
jgi:hypothetical protein